jgi:hypothetical protein
LFESFLGAIEVIQDDNGDIQRDEEGDINDLFD